MLQHDDEVTALILDSLSMGILFCDSSLTIRFVNKAYAALLGQETSEILGRDIRDIIPHSRAADVIQNGKSEMGELCQLGPAGTKPVIVNRIPVHDRSGKVAGMVSQAIFNDPEELDRLSAKIESLGRKLNHYKRRILASLAPQYTFKSILGESLVMRSLKQQARNYALLDEPVLILGPTGAGKELFAHALHAEGKRAQGPFVCINCAAIPRDLFESELFGYSKGAFSGARQEGKLGQIELADKGTLFLDEIGEMPVEIQAKLLRALESRAITPLGSITTKTVDFRLLAATNRNLLTMLEKGSFREDLYYRINTFILQIPPLRERTDDILPIARHLLNRMGHENADFSLAAQEAMRAFEWPGNVRQLHNAVVHAVTMRKNEIIEIDDFPTDLRKALHASFYAAHNEPRDMADSGWLAKIAANAEAMAILRTLKETSGNVSASARKLSISRATLYDKMKKYGIHPRKGFA